MPHFDPVHFVSANSEEEILSMKLEIIRVVSHERQATVTIISVFIWQRRRQRL